MLKTKDKHVEKKDKRVEAPSLIVPLILVGRDRAMFEGEGWESFGDSAPRSRLDGTLDFLQDQFKQVIEDKVYLNEVHARGIRGRAQLLHLVVYMNVYTVGYVDVVDKVGLSL